MIHVTESKSQEVDGTTPETRLNLLLGWASEMGALGLDNVDFPRYFSENFTESDKNFKVEGVSARRDIRHRESILAVPFDMILSPKTFEREEPELNEYILQEAPDLFDEKE